MTGVGKNTGNDDMRRKDFKTYDALLKLREAGAGISITIGTPGLRRLRVTIETCITSDEAQ